MMNVQYEGFIWSVPGEGPGQEILSPDIREVPELVSVGQVTESNQRKSGSSGMGKLAKQPKWSSHQWEGADVGSQG